LITAKFLKKYKLKDLVEEEAGDEACAASEEKASDGNKTRSRPPRPRPHSRLRLLLLLFLF
jgi:hypothetical protein